MKSKLFTLNVRDFLKGLLVAVLTAVITFAYEAIQTGELFSMAALKKMGLVALGAMLAYLLKNLFTNSQDEVLTPEQK